MKITLLGTAIDRVTLEEARKKVHDFFHDGKQHRIVTPNPEFLLLARKDKEFRAILNAADLALPDGAGLFFAAYILRRKLSKRITGVTFIDVLCAEAVRQGKSVFFLGAREGVAKRAGEKLQKRHANLLVLGHESGGVIERVSEGHWRYGDTAILEKIRRARPDILFVALGQGKQEKWIHDNLASLPTVRIAMGVGGALDYIAGTASWAPRWVRGVGLEWLWRFMHEPRRWKRISNAVIVFPIIVLYERFFGKS